jgi:hypothetical protein
MSRYPKSLITIKSNPNLHAGCSSENFLQNFRKIYKIMTIFSLFIAFNMLFMSAV